jgi:hypothetical protein
MQKAGKENTEEVDVVRKQLKRETFTRVMRIINEALAIFYEEGPNTERSANVTRDVLASVRCYSEVLIERKTKASQRCLDYYFKTIKERVTHPNFAIELWPPFS